MDSVTFKIIKRYSDCCKRFYKHKNLTNCEEVMGLNIVLEILESVLVNECGIEYDTIAELISQANKEVENE